MDYKCKILCIGGQTFSSNILRLISIVRKIAGIFSSACEPGKIVWFHLHATLHTFKEYIYIGKIANNTVSLLLARFFRLRKGGKQTEVLSRKK